MLLTEKPKRISRFSYETNIVIKTALCSLPATIITVSLLWYHGADWELWVTCLTFIFLPFPFMVWHLQLWITNPLRVAANVIGAIREGDFTLRSQRTTEVSGTIVELYEEINGIAAMLEKSRISAIETKKVIDKITANIDVASLIIDSKRNVAQANEAAKRLIASINLWDTDPVGKTIDELKIPFVVDESSQDFRGFSIVNNHRRFEGRRGIFRFEGKRFDLVLLTDITRAANEQERDSWKRLLRVLGHELNNSIAPISSLANTLSKITKHSEIESDTKADLQEGLDAISSRSESIIRFMRDYTRLAKLPEPKPKPVELLPILKKAAQLFGENVVLEEDLPNPTVSVDQSQFEQALINLLKNASEASSQTPGAVRCSITTDPNRTRIVIEDDGPGVANPDNLFVPFYTTKEKGSGIGLTLSKQIVEAVRGSLELANREDSHGCRATIELEK